MGWITGYGVVGIFPVGHDVECFHTGDRWCSGRVGMEFKTYPCGKDECGMPLQ